jgi:pyruvate dehydrogenase E2 component (dihydrolipoamide acetyltransferase)
VEVVVPDLGDFSDVEIIDVLVKPGDVVKAEQGLVTLETEKATMDVPSPAAGQIVDVKVKVGDRVSTGSPVASLQQDGKHAGADVELAEEERTILQPKMEKPREEDDRTVRQPAPSVQTVTVPDLGDFTDVPIIEVLVAPGDQVAAEQGLLTLETEKATMDVPAPSAGEVLELKVKVGDRVSAGDAVLVLRPSRSPARESAPPAVAPVEPTSAPEHPPPASASAAPQRTQPQAAPSRGSADAATGFATAHASPSVRKLARELGVDLGHVRGSGQRDRVTAEDVKAFVKEVLKGGAHAGATLPAVPIVDFAKYGEVSVEPLTRVQKISGPRLHASWVNVPHVTQHDEADITELEQMRASLKEQAQERGIKLTPLAFIVRACAIALEEMPLFKSSLGADGDSLVAKHYTHIGFAADTPKGLLVPVIRDADKKDIYELAKSLATLSEQARDGKLRADDMQGAVFTISSLGGIGGRFFTPIINAPEVAILGVSRSQWQAVYRDGGFVPRLMLPISLAYDHRVIDGAKAVHFTTRLGEILGEVEKLVEAIP